MGVSFVVNIEGQNSLSAVPQLHFERGCGHDIDLDLAALSWPVAA